MEINIPLSAYLYMECIIPFLKLNFSFLSSPDVSGEEDKVLYFQFQNQSIVSLLPQAVLRMSQRGGEQCSVCVNP